MESGREGRWAKPLSVAVLLVGFAIGLVGNLATGTVELSGVGVPLTWAATGLLIVTAVILLLAAARSTPVDPATAESRAVAALRERVLRQWEHEAVLRRLLQPFPLRVRWSSTGRPVAADRQAVLGDLHVTWEERPLAGDVEEVVARFRELEHRQLVVLGEGGAGKSVLAVLLTLGLLHNPEKGEPLPVLLPVAAWNPERESIAQFAARRLSEDYADALGPSGGREAAFRLVDQGRLLLILDGLDEIAASLHATGIRRLDDYAATGRALVVTCRSREYERAVRTGGYILSRAAVVEIQPVSVHQAIAFLSHPATSRSRWRKVFAHLTAQPGGAMASVLATPLMVSLARAAYQPPSTDPAELIRVAGKRQIRAKLMDAYIDSVHDPAQPAAATGRATLSYRSQAARRYLETLCLNLDLSGMVELVWWQFRNDLFTSRPSLAPARLSTVIVLASVLVCVPILGVRAGVCIALVGGPLVAAAAGWLRPVWPHNHPVYHSAQSDRSRRRRARLTRAAVGVWCGVLTGLLIDAPTAALFGAVASGLLLPWLPTDRITPRPRTATPDATLGAHHRATLAAAALHALPGAAILASAAALTGASSPSTAALAALLVYGWSAAYPGGLRAWLRYRAIHLRLVARHRLPLRLNAFLHDQHRRGTIRQTGTTWQIRHLILQQHLADQARLHHLGVRADRGDWRADRELAQLLAREDRTDELRTRADGGSWEAGRELAQSLVRKGRIEEAISILRRRADHQDGWYAARELAALLAREGRSDELRVRTDHGDRYAARELAQLLAREGRTAEAITVLRPGAQDDADAAYQLAELLVGVGRIEEAITVLRAHADRNDRDAARRLARLLARGGRTDELRARASEGDGAAAFQLAELLVGEGLTEEAITILRPHADRDGWPITVRLAQLLAQAGRMDELRARAQGDGAAASQLAELLAQEGRTDEAITVLRPHASRDTGVASKLAELLVQTGRTDELRARANQGNWAAASELVELLVGEGQTDDAITVLRLHANEDGLNDHYAVRRLAELLAQEGRTDEAITVLRLHADQGDEHAASQLAQLLAQEGQADEAIAILRPHADQDSWKAASQLAELLAQEGRTDELRARVDQGDEHAASQLAQLLAQEGQTDEAIAILHPHADRYGIDAAQLLASIFREVELAERPGSEHAGQCACRQCHPARSWPGRDFG